MSDKVRVLRILEYVGSREFVEECLKFSSVPADGIRIVNSQTGDMIKAALIDKFPEKIDRPEVEGIEILYRDREYREPGRLRGHCIVLKTYSDIINWLADQLEKADSIEILRLRFRADKES